MQLCYNRPEQNGKIWTGECQKTTNGICFIHSVKTAQLPHPRWSAAVTAARDAFRLLTARSEFWIRPLFNDSSHAQQHYPGSEQSPQLIKLQRRPLAPHLRAAKIIWLIHCVAKKRLSLYNLNNLAKNEPTSIIFGAQNPEEISHQKIRNSPTSPT